MTPTPTDPTLVAAVLRKVAQAFPADAYPFRGIRNDLLDMADQEERAGTEESRHRCAHCGGTGLVLIGQGTAACPVCAATPTAPSIDDALKPMTDKLLEIAREHGIATPTAGTEGGEAEWAMASRDKCVVCGQEIGANKAHYLGDDARGYVVPRSGPYHEACLPTPTAPSAPAMAWDADRFVNAFSDEFNAKHNMWPGRRHIAEAAYLEGAAQTTAHYLVKEREREAAAHAAGVGARAPLPRHRPRNWTEIWTTMGEKSPADAWDYLRAAIEAEANKEVPRG